MIDLSRLALAALAVTTVACDALPSSGELALPLSASTPDGTVYRLRDGTFQIVGPSGLSIGLSTEDDPDAAALHLDLAAGDYQAQLLDGWRLEFSAGGGPFEPVGATLASSNPRGFLVDDGVSTPVTFVFRVAGVGEVALGGGVDLGIDVYTPCDPVAQLGCDAGDRCTRVGLVDGTAITTCVPAGTVAVGEACVVPTLGADSCVAGSLCNDGVCVATCAPGAADCVCAAGSFPDVPDAGVCLPTCDPLAQDCVDPAEACYLSGDGATCAPMVDPGEQGDACVYINNCSAGLVCVSGGGPSPGEVGCATMCSLSGAGPTCADGPGSAFTCIPAGSAYADVGVCIDCAAQPSMCAP